MSRIVLYGDLMSQPCRSLAWTMIFGDIPYELKLIQVLKGDHKTDDFKKINPFSKIPTLEVDGTVILESHAQMRFIAQKYKLEQLYPSDLFERAKVDSYLDWHHLNFRKPCFTYFVSMFMLPKFNVQTDPAKVAEEEKEVTKALHLFQKYWLHEGKTPFITGNTMTLADISAYCELVQLLLFKYDLSEYKVIGEWMKRMETQKGYKESHVMHQRALSKL